nr:Bax inhibitor-1/YccA family protein [Microbacterium sp. CFH 90308]
MTPPPAAQAQYGAAQHAGTDAAAQAHLEGMYAAPSAGAVETDRMTVEDTVWKTVGLFAILLVTAAVGWVWTMAGVTPANPNPSILPWIIGGLGGFVLSLVVIFTSRKKVRPALIFAYAAFEGLFVGGISAFFEFIWPGIVMQATLATFAVVGVTLALFASGKVRASKKATKVFMIAMLGYLVFSLINVGLMLFNVPVAGGAFGLLSQQVFGIPLGLIIGVLVVIMAAYSLVLDFDQIQQGVRNGAPRPYAWVGAFGIMVTVVWLYIEILRILAILRGSE